MNTSTLIDHACDLCFNLSKVMQNECVKQRYEKNKAILNILSEYIERNHDIRFNQALYNLNIIKDDSQYNEESVETYKNLKK